MPLVDALCISLDGCTFVLTKPKPFNGCGPAWYSLLPLATGAVGQLRAVYEDCLVSSMRQVLSPWAG